jgi:serine/threonine protein phosphatase PrpC
VTLGHSTARSDTGRKRRRNEDSYVCEPPLFAVADGMGGAQAGEVASRLAAGTLREASTDGTPEERVAELIQEANRRVYQEAGEDATRRGMGTTVTAALALDDRIVIGHVGDSRAYRIRGGELEQLTQDHSLVAELVRSGKLSPEEAENHPQRSVITRALGTDPDVDVDVFATDTQTGDVYMLCSDGLSGMVDDDAILQLVERHREDLDAAAKALVGAANREGGEDNITVVLFEIAEATAAPSVDETAQMPAVEPDVEDTLSEEDAVPTVEARPLLDHDPDTDEWEAAQLTAIAAPAAADADGASEPEPEPAPRRKRRRGRLLGWALLVVALAGIGVALVWGLARAHFVGAEPNGQVAIYQGVPWDIGAGIRLYRPVYRSRLLTAELSQKERRRLFDHDLVSYATARARLTAFEQGLTP